MVLTFANELEDGLLEKALAKIYAKKIKDSRTSINNISADKTT